MLGWLEGIRCATNAFCRQYNRVELASFCWASEIIVVLEVKKKRLLDALVQKKNSAMLMYIPCKIRGNLSFFSRCRKVDSGKCSTLQMCTVRVAAGSFREEEHVLAPILQEGHRHACERTCGRLTRKQNL
jgi:hypothetical protein